MSVSELYIDANKPWCNIRCNALRCSNVTIDNSMIIEDNLVINGDLTVDNNLIVNDTIQTNLLTVSAGFTKVLWTPQLVFGGSNPGMTYGTQIGSYVKLGNLVFFYVTLLLSNKGSGVGNAQINGFPFSPNEQNYSFPISWTRITGAGSGNIIFASTISGTGNFALLGPGTAGHVTFDETAFSNNSYIQFNGVITIV